MTKITQFTKPVCNALGVEVERELAALAARHGLTVRRAGGKFGATDFTLKIEFKVTDAEAATKSEKHDFEMYCELYNLEPKHYGAVFKSKGQKWKLVGFMPRQPKFPLRAVNVATGQTMFFTEFAADRIRATVA